MLSALENPDTIHEFHSAIRELLMRKIAHRYFLTHQFTHMCRHLQKTVSMRQFFLVHTTYVLVEK